MGVVVIMVSFCTAVLSARLSSEIAINITARMVTGYYVSFEGASRLSFALYLIRAFAHKAEYRANLEYIHPWPAQGKLHSIHVDNVLCAISVRSVSCCPQKGQSSPPVKAIPASSQLSWGIMGSLVCCW